MSSLKITTCVAITTYHFLRYIYCQSLHVFVQDQFKHAMRQSNYIGKVRKPYIKKDIKFQVDGRYRGA